MTQRLVQRHDERQDYETPPEIVAALAAEFGPFDIDVAATSENRKVERFWGPEDNSLSLSIGPGCGAG